MKIGILLGDDIGREVVPECVKVMKAAASRSGLSIDWQPLPIGKAGHEEHGDTLPAVTEQALHKLDGWENPCISSMCHAPTMHKFYLFLFFIFYR